MRTWRWVWLGAKHLPRTARHGPAARQRRHEQAAWRRQGLPRHLRRHSSDHRRLVLPSGMQQMPVRLPDQLLLLGRQLAAGNSGHRGEWARRRRQGKAA